MKAFILVGGEGTRLRPITYDLPKPMVPINGEPFLFYLIEFLKTQNVKDLVLMTGYKPEKIVEYFGDGSNFDINIEYSHEEKFLGTAGALKNASEFIGLETILLMNGDSYLPFNLEEMKKLHYKNDADCTLALTYLEDCSRYGSVTLKENKIISFNEKGSATSGFINGGVYIIEPSVLDIIPLQFTSLEKAIFPKLAEEGKLFGYKTQGYFIDIGTRASYRRFQKDIKDNIVPLR
jgi:NDP-sugar pyrophosphorylase family protein